MRLIEKVILPMLLIFGLTSCDLLHMEATNTRAVEIYDELWNEVNKKYGWEMLDENGQITTDVTKAKVIRTEYLSKEKSAERNEDSL